MVLQLLAVPLRNVKSQEKTRANWYVKKSWWEMMQIAKVRYHH